MVKIINDHETIILNYEIHAHTYHLNITHLTTKHNNMRVNRQRLYLEQMDVNLQHIKGKDNVVVDDLRRLPFHQEMDNGEVFIIEKEIPNAEP